MKNTVHKVSSPNLLQIEIVKYTLECGSDHHIPTNINRIAISTELRLF